jgi:NAD+ diphosphatase
MKLHRLALSRATLDRAAHLRDQPDLLDRLWQDTRTRVVRVGHGRAPVQEVAGRVVLQLAGPQEVPGEALRVFLGTNRDGVGYVAATDTPADGWAGLRQVGAVLDDTDAGLLTESVALLGWHETHQFCPRCGAPTEPARGGWSRVCPLDHSEHHPRTDPAVIMSVVDADDRLLLGHNPAWPERRFSTLAGFVEPGESLESAVRREVAEEVGVPVGDVDYLGSQPWPFPASLMLGFTARALDAQVKADGVEITDARWFTRDELTRSVSSGEVLLPPGVSIARRLIEHWYGAELTDAIEAWR